MRYRRLSPTGDFVFGSGAAEFWDNVPDAVGQAALTRLRLESGEWFLDTTEGTPYQTQILGAGTQQTYDRAIQERILGTQGAKSIAAYASSLQNRRLSVACTIDTIYGQAELNTSLLINP